MAIDETATAYVAGTTRGLPTGQDYDAFCGGISDLYVGVRPESPRGRRFAADFALYRFGPFSLGRISTPGVSAHRDRASVSALADDAIFLNHSAAAWDLVQHGHRRAVAGGAAIVLDNSSPFSVLTDPRRRLDLVSVRIPREELSTATVAALPKLGERLAGTVRGVQLGAQVALLAGAVSDGLSGVARAMAAAAVELLDAVATSDADARAPRRIDALRTHARQHLHDPDFDLRTLARAFACTPRTVQAAFAADGGTFSAWLRDERLDLARAALRLPENAGRSVAAVARAHGFADAGTFHRAYRARFGRTPGADR